MSLLPGKRREDDAAVLPEGHGLRIRRVDRVNLIAVDRKGQNQHEIILHVIGGRLIRPGVDIHLHKAGGPGELLRVHGDAVQLIAYIEFPGGDGSLRIKPPLKEELPRLLRCLPGHTVPVLLRLLRAGHIDELCVIPVVRIARLGIEIHGFYDIGLRNLTIVIQIEIHRLLDGCLRGARSTHDRAEQLRQKAERREAARAFPLKFSDPLLSHLSQTPSGHPAPLILYRGRKAARRRPASHSLIISVPISISILCFLLLCPSVLPEPSPSRL